MGHSEHDPTLKDRRPWNAECKLGAERARKPQQVWAIRFWLDRERRVRDRALFDLVIDSKLRGCDVVIHDDHAHDDGDRDDGPAERWKHDGLREIAGDTQCALIVPASGRRIVRVGRLDR